MSASRSALVLGLAVLGVAIARPGAASTCGIVEYAFVPGPLGTVPRNARVWATLPANWTTIGTCRPLEDRPCKSAHYRIAVRSASTGREVRSVVEETSGDEDHVLSIRGEAPFDKNARYEVWLLNQGGEGAKDQVIGTFVTTDEIDATPPIWTKKLRVVAVRGGAPRKPAITQGRVIVLEAPFMPDGPYVELELDAPIDAQSPFVALRVRVEPESKNAKGAATSTGILTFTSGAQHVYAMLGGRAAPCAYSVVALPSQPGRVKLTFEALDIAGNVGDTTELTVDLPR
jgi:hypothetical protein